MMILFDLDGTLCDSEPGIQRSLAWALKQSGYPVPSDSAIRSIIGPPFAIGLPRIGVRPEDVDRVIATYRARYQDVGAFENSVYPGVEDVLNELQSQGHLLAIATSKPEASAFPILDHFNLSRFFTVRAGATLDNSRSAKADVIQHALNQFAAMGQQPLDAAWMVGDRHHDVEGAIRHNLRCIGVTWGYGTPDELRKAGAAAIAHQPQDLLSILQTHAVN